MDFESVVRALETCDADMGCRGCPIEKDSGNCMGLMGEASRLLRAQKSTIDALIETNKLHQEANGILMKEAGLLMEQIRKERTYVL